MTEFNATPAGWYVDPMTRQHLRWWNGQSWTESVAPLPGAAPVEHAAAAPRVRQQFALGSSASDDGGGASGGGGSYGNGDTSYSGDSSYGGGGDEGFVTRVPAYAARVEQHVESDTSFDNSPAIPWPAMQNQAETGAYQPTYADAVQLLKGTSLVSGSGGTDAAPGYRRGSTGPIATPTQDTDAAASVDTAATAFTQAATSFETQTGQTGETPQVGHAAQAERPRYEVHTDLAYAPVDHRDAAARAAEEAHRAELARQEEARLQWDRELQAQQVAANEARRAQGVYAAAEAQAANQIAPESDELESTLMTRRQRRGQLALTSAPPASEHDEPEEDVWAGADDHRSAPQRMRMTPSWSGSRSATPEHWGTASVWFLTITPWLAALAAFVALTLFSPWSIPAVGVLALPWLVTVLWAQQDSTRLRDFGHADPANPGWAMLTAPVYLVMRTLRVREEMGGGTAPVFVWAANQALVIAIVIAVVVAPEFLPAYLVAALEPLRETAGAWLGR